MYGRTIVLAVAACGWLVASLLAFILVSTLSFFGIGLIETQYEARQKMSDEQRAAYRHEQTLALQSARFFKHLGIALTLIGVAGFVYFQL